MKKSNREGRADSSSLDVYYPYPLVELDGYRAADEHAERGDVLLTFYDETSCRVTIHLERSALIALMRRLLTEPDPSPPPSK